MHADLGTQTFTYAFYAWNGTFAESDLVRQGYELNAPLLTVPGAAGTRSMFSVDSPNVIVETVKPAEDGSDDVIVRLYEAKRMAVACMLTTALPVVGATVTDMLEATEIEALDVATAGEVRGVSLTLRPFEVKTLRLKLGR